MFRSNIIYCIFTIKLSCELDFENMAALRFNCIENKIRWKVCSGEDNSRKSLIRISVMDNFMDLSLLAAFEQFGYEVRSRALN